MTGIGTLWCPLIPDDDYASQATQAEAKGRHGLGAHGGRGDVILKATHGCIRLKDHDMEAWFKAAGKQSFTISVREV